MYLDKQEYQRQREQESDSKKSYDAGFKDAILLIQNKYILTLTDLDTLLKDVDLSLNEINYDIKTLL